MNPQVDGYIRKNKQWSEELEALRRIIVGRGLIEEVKWRVPCYTLGGKNVVILGAFKEWCVLSFLKGALLKDPKKILESAGENTQGVRVVRFREGGLDRIKQLEPVLAAYIDEAIAIEKSGEKVQLKKITEHKHPPELLKKFKEDPKLKAAFRALTPGRQRAYLIYISSAKQSKTRAARIEKHAKRILAGKGLED